MQQIQWRNLQINFEQLEELNDLKREIFNHQIYYFETEEEKPVIIDGGAHIGLATLYFKWLYPAAKVLAFEPNPDLLKLLELNIKQNNLEGVQVIPAALDKHRDKAKFHIDRTDWQWYSTGSMKEGAWNGEQKTREIVVSTVRLGEYLKDFAKIDLLKLDIEGNEFKVILGLKEQINKITNLIFEFHPGAESRLGELISFLQKKGFEVMIKNRKNKNLNCYHERELVLVEAKKKISN